MRRNLILLLAVLSLAACSPETFVMNIEMRHPSRSGLDLSRKSMAVVYADNGHYNDTLFLRNVSSGFAEKMEEDYFGGQELISMFSTQPDTAQDSRARLQQLIMETGSDVVFFFDTPEFGEPMIGDNSVVQPFKLRLYVYDSMNQDDKVLSFNGSSAVQVPLAANRVYSPSALSEQIWSSMPELAAEVGRRSTGNFVSTWETEFYSLYYYNDMSSEWEESSQAAYEYRWTDAIKIWTKILESKNPEKRACASYDIATACYMLGNYPLALQWLDLADKESTLSLSPGLRKRILARMK